MPHRFTSLFTRPKPVIAVLHTGPTPGVSVCSSSRCAAERAAAETRLLVELGVDGFLIENMHDAPALREQDMGPEVAAYMTRVALAVKRNADRLPVGIRVMHDASRTSLAVALAAGCDFIRVDGWERDDGAPARFHRYRHSLDADAIPVLAGIRPRHPEDVERLLEQVEESRPEVIAVLGPQYGKTPAVETVEQAREHTHRPLLVGGGLNASNLDRFAHLADGLLIGSGLKEGGSWRAPVCEPSVRSLVGTVEYARGQEVRS
ncbi:MAG: BtpA/SgcQ family protein [Bacteroidota bacterium]